MILESKTIAVNGVKANVKIKLIEEKKTIVAKISIPSNDLEAMFAWEYTLKGYPVALSIPDGFNPEVKKYIKDYIINRLWVDNVIIIGKDNKELEASFTRFNIDNSDYLEIYHSQYVRYIDAIGNTYAWQPYVYTNTAVLCNDGFGTGVKNKIDAGFIRSALRDLGFTHKSHMDTLFANAGINPITLSQLAQEARQKAIEESAKKQQVQEQAAPAPITVIEKITPAPVAEKIEELKQNIAEAKTFTQKTRKKYW